MRGFFELRVGCGCVAALECEADVTGAFVPNLRRAGLQRIRQRYGWQRFVIDHHQFGCVFRLHQSFGDNEGDTIADMPHLCR